MQAIGNTGWYRVNVRGIPRGVTGSTQVRAVLYVMKTGTSSYTGDGTSGLYASGGELLQQM
jgi:hypothetical protein